MEIRPEAGCVSSQLSGFGGLWAQLADSADIWKLPRSVVCFPGTPNTPKPGVLFCCEASSLSRCCSEAVSLVPALPVGLGMPSFRTQTTWP